MKNSNCVTQNKKWSACPESAAKLNVSPRMAKEVNFRTKRILIKDRSSVLPLLAG